MQLIIASYSSLCQGLPTCCSVTATTVYTVKLLTFICTFDNPPPVFNRYLVFIWDEAFIPHLTNGKILLPVSQKT